MAFPDAARIQAALTTAKVEGSIQLEGLGQFSWAEVIALVDVLFGIVWTDLTLAEQEDLWVRYTEESRETRGAGNMYGSRHDSLRFLAWFLEDWPRGAGPTIARELLMRWLSADRNRICRHLHSPCRDPWTVGPTNFEPAIRERLRSLAGAP